jgi:RHS repeat-associated protein
VALSAASDGSPTARYEYAPFGEPISLTGPAAANNPFRFRTKRTCNTTDLVLYEYRTYSPSLGRWPNRHPIGELGFKTLRWKCTRGFASAGNLYGFVGNNPLNSFDVFGLYEYEWEGALTEAEKQAIKDSIHRVRDRANALIKQIDDNIKNLKRCPCPAYDELAKKLEGLKKILQGMVKEIDDPGWNLEVYKKNMPGRDAEYWNSPVPWLDDELRLNPSWFGQGTTDQDTTMFHEITHGQGTVDDDFSNPYNNAHALEGLMHTDKENWIYFKFDKQDADKKCNPAGK